MKLLTVLFRGSPMFVATGNSIVYSTAFAPLSYLHSSKSASRHNLNSFQHELFHRITRSENDTPDELPIMNDDDREQTLASLGLDPRNNDALLEYSIDSFLRGEYDRPFEENAVAPLPGLTPGATVEQAFGALRKLDDPEPSHGAACFLRFCVPLRRGERWSPPSSTQSSAAWKELLRGSLTPTMLARRLRASPDFSILLDWDKMDVTEGAVTGKDDFAMEDAVAFVNAAFYCRDMNEEKGHRKTNSSPVAGTAPELLQIKLLKVGGVWLIDAVQQCPMHLFQKRVSFNTEDDSEGSR